MSKQDRKTIGELKEAAKWSRDKSDMKAAISELATSYGDEALPSVEEILTVTAYEDIKAACIEAIKTIKEKTTEGKQGKKEQ